MALERTSGTTPRGWPACSHRWSHPWPRKPTLASPTAQSCARCRLERQSKAAEGGGIAIDGQCGTVLRSYRGHPTSADSTFLQTNWPKIKLVLEFLIHFSTAMTEILTACCTASSTTLWMPSWYGKVHAISSLYIASLRAGEEMAKMQVIANSKRFAATFTAKEQQELRYCLTANTTSRKRTRPSVAIGVGPGVYIDQVIGQFWANQLGLGRV